MFDSGPSGLLAEVMPSDTVNFTAGPCRALYVGSGGSVTCVVGGEAFTFANVQSGSVLPVRCSRVNATATTATTLLALY